MDGPDLTRQRRFGGDQRVDECGELTEGLNGGCLVLRDRNPKVIFELEHELQKSQRVDSKLADGSIRIDRVGLSAKLFGGKLGERGECVHGTWNVGIVSRRAIPPIEGVSSKGDDRSNPQRRHLFRLLRALGVGSAVTSLGPVI